MKCTVTIDPDRPQEVQVFAHRETELTAAIRRLCEDEALELVGYRDGSVFPLRPGEVVCFLVESGRVMALTREDKLEMKCRLYQLEAVLPAYFVKIHQSCLANLQAVERFDASLAGTLAVHFCNGHKDYVSRRQLKTVKERLGL